MKRLLVSYFLVMIVLPIMILNASTTTTTTNETASKFECQLYNDYYTGEYLYAESDKLKMHPHVRFVHTWKLGNSKVTTKQLPFNVHDTKAIWQLIFVKKEETSAIKIASSTFLIRNVKYDEYLFASDDGTNIMRRKVCTKWSPMTNIILQCLDQHGDLKCKKKHKLVDKSKMWIISPHTFGSEGVNIEKEDESFRKVTIYNAAFGEAMYAPGLLSGSSYLFSRQVHTWHKAPDSAQFNWILKCKDNRYPPLF